MVITEKNDFLQTHTYTPTWYITPMVQWEYTGYNGPVTDSD